MDDQPPESSHVPAAEVNGQLIVALSIVGAMILIAVALIIAGTLTKEPTMITGGVFTIIGALATALNAPTGISNAIRAVGKTDSK
jgi:predicted Co/Zn/Cd cation transporter (cation efflux family)